MIDHKILDLFCMLYTSIVHEISYCLSLSHAHLITTMVKSGVVVTLSVKYVVKKWSGFGDLTRNSPYFSEVLILAIAGYVVFGALRALNYL